MVESKHELVDGVMQSSLGEMNEKEVDENLEGTFPASDPPSWTLGTDHREEPPEKESINQPEDESLEE